MVCKGYIFVQWYQWYRWMFFSGINDTSKHYLAVSLILLKKSIFIMYFVLQWCLKLFSGVNDTAKHCSLILLRVVPQYQWYCWMLFSSINDTAEHYLAVSLIPLKKSIFIMYFVVQWCLKLFSGLNDAADHCSAESLILLRVVQRY